MARKLRERRLTLIPIGPLTNIALLLATHPELHAPDRADRDHGRRDRHRQRHPERRVQRLGRPGGRLPRLHQRPGHHDGRPRRHPPRDALAPSAPTRCARRAAPAPSSPTCTRFYRQFHERVYGHSDTPVHDALAVAHVIEPDVITTEPCPVEIDVTQGPCRGRTVVDQLRRTGQPANALRRHRRRRGRVHRSADRADRRVALSRFRARCSRHGRVPLPAPAGRVPAAQRAHGVPRLGAEPGRHPSCASTAPTTRSSRPASASSRRPSTPARGTTTPTSSTGSSCRTRARAGSRDGPARARAASSTRSSSTGPTAASGRRTCPTASSTSCTSARSRPRGRSRARSRT